MNPIIIPPKYNYTKFDWFISETKKYNFDYKIDNRNINYIQDQIKKSNNYIDYENIELNLGYFLYKLYKTNNIENPLNDSLEGGEPFEGFKLVNKKNGKSLGVYHCHLSRINSSVLVWYPQITNRGLHLHIDYLEDHPSDDYRDILGKIYNRQDDGYHEIEGDYFINLNKLLNFNTNESLKIKKFKEF